MATITIKGNKHEYDENEIITFPEGLVGLPQFRRAVVISMNDLEPFCWLAPLEDNETRFIVVDPHTIFEGYEPGNSSDAGDLQAYAIVTVPADWKQTTINLRAPILIDRSSRTGAQRILSDSQYHFAENLPQL